MSARKSIFKPCKCGEQVNFWKYTGIWSMCGESYYSFAVQCGSCNAKGPRGKNEKQAKLAWGVHPEFNHLFT